jgi:hypothetical protein
MFKTALVDLRKHKNLLPLLVIFLVLVTVTFAILLIKPATKVTNTATPSANPQETNGPLYGVWGTVVSIDENKNIVGPEGKGAGKGPGSSDSAIVTIKSDSGQEYKAEIVGSTIIRKIKTGEKTQPILQWRDALKKGQRVYLYSSLDLKEHFYLKYLDVTEISYYEN